MNRKTHPMIPSIERGAQMMLHKTSRYMTLHLFGGAAAMFGMLCVLTVSLAIAGGDLVQKTFPSAQQAVEALIAAVQDNDDAELIAIFGPGSEDLVISGDEIADQNGRERFLQAYEEKNILAQDTEGRAVLFVGSNDYPLPIPIVKQGEAWIFDTQAGQEEILNRRIGRNELHTIEVMEAYTAAQREYACMKRDGGGSEFAQKLTSRQGHRDGLYWEAAEGEEESPFGPLIAQATEQGYDGGLDQDPPEPFHGYFFKILTKQGPHATGGAFDYVVDGKMILGFALVAYPAKYGASGIMTFIVNQEGIIYEKDFGEDTNRAAPAMTTFDPDETWTEYLEPEEQQ